MCARGTESVFGDSRILRAGIAYDTTRNAFEVEIHRNRRLHGISVGDGGRIAAVSHRRGELVGARHIQRHDFELHVVDQQRIVRAELRAERDADCVLGDVKDDTDLSPVSVAGHDTVAHIVGCECHAWAINAHPDSGE